MNLLWKSLDENIWNIMLMGLFTYAFQRAGCLSSDVEEAL